MRTTILAMALAVTAVQIGSARGEPGMLRIDPARSVAQFTVTKLGFSNVTGRFTEVAGEVRWNASDPASGSVRMRARVASVLTDASNRDRTLQAPEYFDARNHPDLIFESTRVVRADADTLRVTGNLTMRGHTRPVTLTVRHSGTASAPVFEASFDVDRYDYGIVGGRVMSRLIGRSVRIDLKVVTLEPTS